MRRLFRLHLILKTAAKYRLHKTFPQFPGRKFIDLIQLISPSLWISKHRFNRGESIRLTLETLGPIFIKFGQILSTRRDLLPADIADELAKLQDDVPPFASEQAQRIVETAFNRPLAECFHDFDPTPLASASIAQVHTAKRLSGEDVIVKIVRPDIKKTIAKDIRLLYFIAKWARRLSKAGKQLRPVEVVSEFDKTIHHELNMLREASNASEIRRNFEGSDIIYVPKVYFDDCRSNILVMERVYGTRISDIDTLKANHINMEKLARHGVEIFMTQVFRDSFFHADMHPGNVLVDIHDRNNPKYCAIDFGIVGTLDQNDQRYLAENLLAFFERDYRRIAELHVESLWVPENTDVAEFTSAIRTLCEPIFQKPMSEISFAALLLSLFQVARQFNMQIQPQLILLQKTLLNIEGLGRELYPELDLWDTVYPYLKQWMRQRYSVSALMKTLIKRVPHLLEKLTEMTE